MNTFVKNIIFLSIIAMGPLASANFHHTPDPGPAGRSNSQVFHTALQEGSILFIENYASYCAAHPYVLFGIEEYAKGTKRRVLGFKLSNEGEFLTPEVISSELLLDKDGKYFNGQLNGETVKMRAVQEDGFAARFVFFFPKRSDMRNKYLTMDGLTLRSPTGRPQLAYARADLKVLQASSADLQASLRSYLKAAPRSCY